MGHPLTACRVSAYTDEDDDGFYWVVCGCELRLGPAPDQETATDMAMEHAWEMGYRCAVAENAGVEADRG